MQVDSLPATLWFRNGRQRPQKKKKIPTAFYLDACNESCNCSLWEYNKLRNETVDRCINLALVHHGCLMRDNICALQFQNKMNNLTKTLV